jgi:hypothetical protein
MRWLLVVALVTSCSKQREENATPAPSQAPPAAPAAPPGSTLDCGAVITQADVEAACGNAITSAKVGPGERPPMCHRTFASAKGDLEVIIAHEAQPNTAPTAYQMLHDGAYAEAKRDPTIQGFEDLPEIGDSAFRYAEGIAKGSPKIVNVLRGPKLITIRTNGVLGERGEMCSHAQVADLARRVVARLP